MAEETLIDEAKRLTAYNVKTKEKGVPIYNAVIKKTSWLNRSSYTAKGTTEDGSTKLSAILSLARAEEAINAGVAARGEGWE